MKRAIFLILISFNLAYCQEKKAENISSLPILESSINDFEDVFDQDEENILKVLVESFYDQRGIGITVVSVNSIEPYERIFDYSLDLANQSGRGQVIIVFSKKLSQIQIQNHDSIREKLTDEETEKILNQFILPEFTNANYFKGIQKAIVEIKKELF